MRTLVGYLIAAILGIFSHFAHDQPWIGAALWYAAFAVALFVTLGLVHDRGLVGRVAKLLRAARLVPVDARPTEHQHSVKPTPHAKVPRPAGPVGPIPVLQKRPQGVADAPIGVGPEKNTTGSPDTQ
jgi:hypothetical protein